MKEADTFFINQPSNKIPEDLTSSILNQSKPIEYHKNLSGYQSTPLVHLPSLAEQYGVSSIHIKDESSRFGLNAFKSLGASFVIHSLLKSKPDIQTFCTATDGNHGRAVAWASSSSGKQSVIYVPRDTSQNRIEAIKNERAQIIQLDKNYDETCEYAERISKENGWELVQDTAWENYTNIPALIMAGYQTQFKEIEDSLHSLPKPKIDLVFLQVGVGSWAGSGIWYYLNRYGGNRPKIVLVEPEESDGALASFLAGKRTSPSGSFETIMGGLNCGIPSLTAWNILKNGADAAMKISDDYAKKAMRTLYHPVGSDRKITSGESGAAGLAGFMALMTDPQFSRLKQHLNITHQTRILFFNTEGATDQDSFDSIVSSI